MEPSLAPTSLPSASGCLFDNRKMPSLVPESLNGFEQQLEKCESTLESISLASASSPNTKVAQPPLDLPFKLNGKDDLLSLIRHNVNGLLVADIKHSYPSVMDDLMALKAENLVWLFPKMGSQEDIVYPNETKELLKMSDDVWKLFLEPNRPRHFVDLEAKLLKRGMDPETKMAKIRAVDKILGMLNSKPKECSDHCSNARRYPLFRRANACKPEPFCGDG